MPYFNVSRKVDTVIVEMDISTAEALAEIMGHTIDHTNVGVVEGFLCALTDNSLVRWPSNLYAVEAKDEQIHVRYARTGCNNVHHNGHNG